MAGIGIKKAFLLAGGEGTRLRPLTFEIPKVLVSVKQKPLIEWNIELCKNFGVKEIVLALGYKAEQVQNYCEERISGVKIKCNIEKEFLGTAGALKFAQSFFENENKFIMMNGDTVMDIDFVALNNVFEKNNAVGAIALTETDDPMAGGIIQLQGEKIASWAEKPTEAITGKALLNSGVYILSNNIFNYIPAKEKVSIEKQTFPAVIKDGKLFGSSCVSQFFQADTFDRYEKAIFGWKGFEKQNK